MTSPLQKGLSVCLSLCMAICIYNMRVLSERLDLFYAVGVS